MKNRFFTRRDFIKSTTRAAAAGALFSNLPLYGSANAPGIKRVVLIRDSRVLDRLNRPRPEILEKMLDEAVTVLLMKSDALRAWRRLIQPADIVGIKSNVWHYLPTPAALEAIIKKKVLTVGVSNNRISVGDRSVRRDPVFNNASALINVRPLRTHHWSGVGSLIKNYIMFSSFPPFYHPDSCADLATIWKKPSLHGKTRLNILVMLTPLFHGIGPHHFSPKYTWVYSGLLAGTDPVAVDSVGVRILQAKRKLFFGEERPINPPPKHILLADTRHHLGTADPAKIELIKIGWEKDILI